MGTTGWVAPRESAKAAVDCALRRVLKQAGGRAHWKFDVMLRQVQAQSDLLRPGWLAGRVDEAWIGRIATGLLALYRWRRHWLRPVESWVPPEGGNPIGVFASLVHHLMAKYPVPPVLLSAWFTADERPGQRYQTWYQRAGRGKPLREVGLTTWLPMTRRMVHCFALAPAAFSIPFAMRWAQVRGMGGSDALARALADTRLGREQVDDEEWAEAIGRLVGLEPFDLGIIPDFVAFYHDRKLDNREVLIGEGEGTASDLSAPEPGLSIAGWSAASLKRRVEAWKAERARDDGKPKRVRMTWPALAGVAPLEETDESGRRWTIAEVTDSDALAAEGAAMHNCVATYLNVCLGSRASIWSLRVEEAEGGARRSVVTIEVDPRTRAVVQAKAACNEEPDEEGRSRLNRWAEQAGLGREWEGEG
jgi:hypothetical protein